MVMRRNGQTALEYATVAVVLAAALVGMSLYMKRGISGRFRGAADSIGEQYAPKQTDASFTITVSSDTTTNSKLIKDKDLGRGQLADVIETTTTINNDTTTRTGRETVGQLGTDLWKQ